MYINFGDLFTLTLVLSITSILLAIPFIIGFFLGLSKGRTEQLSEYTKRQ